MRKNNRWNKYRGVILAALAGMAGMVVLVLLMQEQVWKDYREKMMIAGTLLSAEEDSRQALFFSLLKGEEAGLKQAEESLVLLQEYGYMEKNGNVFDQEARDACGRILGIGVTVYGAYLLVLVILWKAQSRNSRVYIRKISYMLEQFGKQNYCLDSEWEDSALERIHGQLQEMGEALKFMQERMQQEKEETKGLVTDISHQLKTPVSALKACFEILQQEGLSPEERQEFSLRCSRQLSGLENLLQALLDISRMESGMIQIQKEPGDIIETVASAVSRVWMKAEAKGISIEMEESIESSWKIPHDAKWTAEAFINLLENAVKYSPKGSVITIRMSGRTSFLRIEIEDEGIGIPKEEYHKIFKRFYRGQAEAVRQEDGSGVGLYLTREILERQGGSVTVNSKTAGPQQGTVFVVQIPYV